MTFASFLRKYAIKTRDPVKLEEAFLDHLDIEFATTSEFLKDKERDQVVALRTTCATDLPGLDDPQTVQRLIRFVNDLEALKPAIGLKLERRRQKAATEREGREAMALARTETALARRIHGDRVLHFTTAFAPIVQSKKLRISNTSDQGCIFCVPARYAGFISDEAPANVKQYFDIHGDLSHYIEFNLEASKDFESFNSRIDKKLKGQKELKIFTEILDLDLRDPVWYEWKGKSQGGWMAVPGPIPWGK